MGPQEGKRADSRHHLGHHTHHTWKPSKLTRHQVLGSPGETTGECQRVYYTAALGLKCLVTPRDGSAPRHEQWWALSYKDRAIQPNWNKNNEQLQEKREAWLFTHVKLYKYLCTLDCSTCCVQGSCIKHQLAHSTKDLFAFLFLFFLLSRLSERIWVRSVSEHRTWSLNSRKDTKATASTVQQVGILCKSVWFVLLLTITSYSQGNLVN